MSPRCTAFLLLGLAAATGWGCSPEPPPKPDARPLVDAYLDAWLAHYPTRASTAGRREHDSRLEDFSRDSLARWIELNRKTLDETRALRSLPDLDPEDALDLELLQRRLERELFELEVLESPRRDPLLWTGVAGNATIFLLVRQDRPVEERLTAAAARARQIPRFVDQALGALGRAGDQDLDPEIVSLAANQARSSASFYREGFPAAAAVPGLADEMSAAGAEAGRALDQLAEFLDGRVATAAGDERRRELYPSIFRVTTGIEAPVSEILAEAEEALAAKRLEVAGYGRSVWSEVGLPGDPPADDRELVARLFRRVAEDHAASTDELVDDYRDLVRSSIEFVRERSLMTLPDPLAIRVESSPSFFLGQSVGGVYPAGPWSEPGTETLLFLPTPSPGQSGEALEAFFRDFNDHFSLMITPHEIVPGHTLQLLVAARQPRKVRALFADGVYVEGWGTFCERLMLDLGWGGPLDRLAHLKKQLENIARTIVDIRVHTGDLERDDMLAFLRDEALQDEQFAGNMWTRAITASPQLTYYYLGYRQVSELYRDVRQRRGDGFDLRTFLDGMMELGPVPVRHYRARMLGAPTAPGPRTVE